MRVQLPPKPSAEQLKILQRPLRPIEIIKGAAGSGKTVTALYKLIFALSYMSQKKTTLGVAILSFNKTLKGYIEAMLTDQRFHTFPKNVEITLSVETFSRWAMHLCGMRSFNEARFSTYISSINGTLSPTTKLTTPFLEKEIAYILKRFPHNDLGEYISAKRHGRGAGSNLDQKTREIIVNNYIPAYTQWKQKNAVLDWEDIAWKAVGFSEKKYDIIVVDEGQDFTANQYRAIVNALAEDSTLICVIDTAQKIYLNGFTWAECGIDARKYQPVTLSANFRNTKEIATLAGCLLNGVALDEDGVQPQSHSTACTGPLPVLLQGKFSKQTDYIIEKISQHLSARESCAILLKKDTWSSEVRTRLTNAGLSFANITRADGWPGEDTNLVISTMHSAKGLEFDHVFMPGICAEGFPQYDTADEEDEHQDRRLLAMAIGRGRKTVTLGEKPGEECPYFVTVDAALLKRVRV